MREFTNNITFVKNFRGVYELDTSKGCSSGIANNPKGCYSDCYAARYSKKYGYDFSKTILRDFKNEKNLNSIIKKINNIDMDFIRFGVSGDPSENWEHTLKILDKIKESKKTVVIITKHWNMLTLEQLNELSKHNVCVNTSISALDNELILKHRLSQYNTLKNYCNSVLRIVSCDFNIKNKLGKKLNYIQSSLFDNEKTIDTVFRLYLKNEYATSGLLNYEKIKFLGKNCNVSMHNKNTFIGFCKNCPEMCGININ